MQQIFLHVTIVKSYINQGNNLNLYNITFSNPDMNAKLPELCKKYILQCNGLPRKSLFVFWPLLLAKHAIAGTFVAVRLQICDNFTQEHFG